MVIKGICEEDKRNEGGVGGVLYMILTKLNIKNENEKKQRRGGKKV
jgi:hypothetical protein